MLTVLALLVVAVAVLGPPLLLIVGLGAVIDWSDRRRGHVIAHQVRLTDALYAQGLLLAPVVEKRLWRPWTVSLVVPSDRLPDVGQVVGIARQVLLPVLRAPDDLRVVITRLGPGPARGPEKSAGLLVTHPPGGRKAA